MKRHLISPLLAVAVLFAALPSLVEAAAPLSGFVNPNPNLGDQFGRHMVVLSTGNVVITDPSDNAAGPVAGAVYLFNGQTGALISTLTGKEYLSRVGSGGIVALPNGNFLVRSPNWTNSVHSVDIGAVTWGSGVTGVSGEVSAANSLVGAKFYNRVGLEEIVVLGNGNYVVPASSWGGAAEGAVTYCNGATGTVGVVGPANSLVGGSPGDGQDLRVQVLRDNHCLVIWPGYNNGAAADAGAVTWVGPGGLTGVISAANSLVGSTGNDRVGASGIVELSTGHYLVPVPGWDNGSAIDAGAVAFGNYTAGVSGAVNAENSLVGTSSYNEVAKSPNTVLYPHFVTLLSNGNYLVLSPGWDDGAKVDVGAVTWGSAATGVTGPVSAENSLTGASSDDQAGLYGCVNLTNGNYVVWCPTWDNGSVQDAGSATWGGPAGVHGRISAENSLVGTRSAPSNRKTSNLKVTALANGNYVVCSPFWGDGAFADLGAVTWADGSTGLTGVVTAENSLTGAAPGALIGIGGITPLPNGHYVVSSPFSNTGAVTNAGAVTWCNGTGPQTGVVSSENSLVGASTGDNIGRTYDSYDIASDKITVLSNSNYIVRTTGWDNTAEAGATDAGAVTWCSGTGGGVGVVSAANSLVGGSKDDLVGFDGVTELKNGHCVVRSSLWKNGAAGAAGAVTWINGVTGTAGYVSAANSLVGTQASDKVGSAGVTALGNGNYVVLSNWWNNAGVTDAGAVTWGDGTTGTTGPVSPANSLVGSRVNDCYFINMTELRSGNYLVGLPQWDSGSTLNAGAVTWCSGATGRTGAVSAENSLAGRAANETLGSKDGSSYISQLENGNYLVHSRAVSGVHGGSITWGSGTAGVAGVISAANSLVGARPTDHVGSSSITLLSNGNYVVNSRFWDSGTTDDNAGALTFGDGTAGVSGMIGPDVSSIIPFTLGQVVLDPARGTFLVAASNGQTVQMGSQIDGFAPSRPDIEVSGNGQEIPNGDTTPAAADHTDFGRCVAAGGVLTRSFTVKNVRTDSLNLTGAPEPVTITGPDAAHFTVTAQPATPVATMTAGTPLVITFAPGTAGVKSATVNIPSDDEDEPLYTFTIQGEGRSLVTAGDDWTAQAAGSRSWTSLTASADGTKLAAATNGGKIYTSADSGLTWTERESNRFWSCITSSADGVKLAATADRVYTSTDSGVTWTARTDPGSWRSIASSADGVRLAAVVNNGRIYTSTDSGATWTARDGTRGWQCIASSADGMKLAAAVIGGRIYTSVDAGLTWTPRESNRGWYSITCSGDGALVAAVADHVYVSTDSGETFTPRDVPRSWNDIASSTDGTKLVATTNFSGRVYASTDSGANWTAVTATRDWGPAAISGDGSLLAAAVYNGAIWTSRSSPDPRMSLSGNGQAITNGSTTPTTTNHTDFGGVALGAAAALRTFTIVNSGQMELNLTGVPKLTVTGAHAAEFTVSTQPVSPVPGGGGSTSFGITFKPGGLGLRTATVNISCDDAAQNPCSFAIAGTGAVAAHPVNAVSGPHGSLSPEGVQVVPEGESRTFTATPDAGYFIHRWRANGVVLQTGGESFTLTGIAGATTVSVNFKAAPRPALFTTPMQSQVALLGGPAIFEPAITGDDPMTYQWRKGTAVIANASLPYLTIPATTAADAGAYSLTIDNDVGPPAESGTAYLALVTPGAGRQIVRERGSLMLRCTATAPAAPGVSLSYSWRRGGVPLVNGTQTNGAVVAGADKAALSITRAGMADSGTYTCLVTLVTPGNDPSLTNGNTVVTVLGDPPVMNAIPLPATVSVSQSVDVTLSAEGEPTGFTATGLPKGLKLDLKTGRITGRPTEASKKDSAGNYIPGKITFKAANGWGNSPGVEIFMTVEALPAAMIGAYQGIVARSPHSNFGHGGHVQITVAATGAFTGTATLAGQRHSFTGAVDPADGADPGATVVFNRNPIALGSLRMRLHFATSEGSIQGVILDPQVGMAQGQFAAGNLTPPGLIDGDFQSASFNLPAGIAVRADGTVYIADAGNHAIREIDPLQETVRTLAGVNTPGSADDFRVFARFNAPEGVAVDAAGKIFVADTGNSTIRVIGTNGVVSTFAGTAGQPGGTNGTGAAARFTAPCGMCFDPAGNLYVVDRGNHTLRKITPAGVVTTLLGLAGTPGYKDGSGAVTRLNTPTGIAFDPVLRSLFITDTGNCVIRRAMLTGVTSTYAGSAGVAGDNGGPAANARFRSPRGILSRGNGTLIVADTVLRQISSNGIVSAISEKLSEGDHPVALAWHEPSASLLALHDTLNSLSSHSGSTPREDAVFTARRNPWTSTNTVPAAERVRYNATLETTLAPDAAGVPLGSGYASVTIAANGNAAWAGKTADGGSFTFSTVMAADRVVPLHVMTHLNTGSLQGEALINNTTFAITGGTTPAFDWVKTAQPLAKTDVSYKSGFPLHALNLHGGRYMPGNAHSYLGLSASPANLWLRFAASRIVAFNQLIALAAPNKVTVPPNVMSLTLRIEGPTGVFSGTFRGGIPSVAASYAGILFDDQAAGSKRGQGYFLLPDTVGSTSPVQSRNVTLEAFSSP